MVLRRAVMPGGSGSSWVKGQYEARPIVERWNSFSRIRVIGDPNRVMKPSGWGLSATLPADATRAELHLDIDSYAGTELTAFNGDPATVEHLKYDVTNVAHYLRPDSSVVVVGTGGGRDVLSALVFDQRAVTGVEINERHPRSRQSAVRRLHRPPRSRSARPLRQRRGAQLSSPACKTASTSSRSR